MGRGLALFARHADGTELPVDISLAPLPVAGRRLFSCSIRDLRGRAHGPDSLRVQATALRSAANGIVITDAGGTITWVNPAASAMTAALTGADVEAVTGTGTGVDGEGRRRKLDAIRRALAVNRPDGGDALDVLAKVGQ